MNASYREFSDVQDYTDRLLGKRVTYVNLNPIADEGLVLRFEDGTCLRFGFSGGEGKIEFE